MVHLDDFPAGDEPTDAFPKAVADGRYVLERPIGTGPGGTIFRAKDTKTGGIVSVKLLHDTLTQSDKDVQRFVNEAKSMLDIRHPHVVRMIESGQDVSGRYYHVMDLVDGITLEQAMAKGYAISEVQALDIALDVLAGLVRVHTSGRVHRDIKPSNVLLHPNGDALLTGFDVVRMADGEFVDRLTNLDDTVGELGFAANEQRGDPHNVGPQADLYSVGALVYVMMVGGTPPDLSLPSSRRELKGELPVLISPIVLKATEYNVDDRYETAAEMAADLVETRDQIARRVGRAARGAEWLNWLQDLTPASEEREVGPRGDAKGTSKKKGKKKKKGAKDEEAKAPSAGGPVALAFAVGLGCGIAAAAAGYFLL